MAERINALAAVQKSGLLNPKLTMGELMEVASRLDFADGINPGEELGWWAVVGPNYVVAGGAVDLEQIARTLR